MRGTGTLEVKKMEERGMLSWASAVRIELAQPASLR